MQKRRIICNKERPGGAGSGFFVRDAETGTEPRPGFRPTWLASWDSFLASRTNNSQETHSWQSSPVSQSPNLTVENNDLDGRNRVITRARFFWRDLLPNWRRNLFTAEIYFTQTCRKAFLPSSSPLGFLTRDVSTIHRNIFRSWCWHDWAMIPYRTNHPTITTIQKQSWPYRTAGWSIWK